MKRTPMFAKETDLCAAFIVALPKGWTAYPETAGWDILLSRDSDGIQIGVQAKLKLNAEVINQAIEQHGAFAATHPGPDFRAVLVPADANRSLATIAEYAGLTVIRVSETQGWPDGRKSRWFDPRLPDEKWSWGTRHWHHFCPTSRERLPDFIPDVVAGDKAPLQLTEWKIKAIKIAVLLETRGHVTRSDFKALDIDHRRWIAAKWIVPQNGVYIAGKAPDFRAQHPKNFEEIKAVIADWMPGAAA